METSLPSLPFSGGPTRSGLEVPQQMSMSWQMNSTLNSFNDYSLWATMKRTASPSLSSSFRSNLDFDFTNSDYDNLSVNGGMSPEYYSPSVASSTALEDTPVSLNNSVVNPSGDDVPSPLNEAPPLVEQVQMFLPDQTPHALGEFTSSTVSQLPTDRIRGNETCSAPSQYALEGSVCSIPNQDVFEGGAQILPYPPPTSQQRFQDGKVNFRRVTCACLNCKRSKAKCDKQRPCSRCIRLDKAGSCVDCTQRKRGRKKSSRGMESKKASTDFHTLSSQQLLHAITSATSVAVASVLQGSHCAFEVDRFTSRMSVPLRRNNVGESPGASEQGTEAQRSMGSFSFTSGNAMPTFLPYQWAPVAVQRTNFETGKANVDAPVPLLFPSETSSMQSNHHASMETGIMQSPQRICARSFADLRVQDPSPWSLVSTPLASSRSSRAPTVIHPDVNCGQIINGRSSFVCGGEVEKPYYDPLEMFDRYYPVSGQYESLSRYSRRHYAPQYGVDHLNPAAFHRDLNFQKHF